jgi:hypothetical protein
LKTPPNPPLRNGKKKGGDGENNRRCQDPAASEKTAPYGTFLPLLVRFPRKKKKKSIALFYHQTNCEFSFEYLI